MKLNHIFLGLGVMALALTACSDEVEYTPAAPVNTPAAYFSIADPTEIDLEETDTQYSIKIYRADTTGELTVPVTTLLTDAEGAPVDASLFTYPADVTFADGSDVAEYTLTFEIPTLEPMKVYVFDLTVDGENSPYYLTHDAFNVCYTPWEPMHDCQMLDNCVFIAFGGQAEQFEIKAFKHPTKTNFFRVRSPYQFSPWDYMYIKLDPELPNYLYVNAANPDAVFLSDSKGNPQALYNTGLYCNSETHFAEEYGYLYLICGYSCFVAETNLNFFGYEADFEDFASWAGTFKITDKKENACVIDFNNNMASGMSLFSSYGEFRGANWELWLNGATNEPWADLGIAEYYDGYMAEYYMGVPVEPYKVPIQVNTEEDNVYRLINPYAYGTCPYGYEEDQTFNLIIDCSNPKCVQISRQAIWPAQDGDSEIEAYNAAFYYTSMVKEDEQLTDQQIIDQGLNDVFKDGVITISHPMLRSNGKNIVLYEKSKWKTPVKIVLPTEAPEENDEPEAAPAKARTIVAKPYRK